MAAGPWIIYGLAKEAMLEGVIGPLNQSGTPRFRIALVTSSYTPSVNADDTWSDVSTNEVANGNGYVTHGQLLAMTCTHAAGTVTVDSTTDGSWTTSTITAKYAVVVQDADANGALAAGDRLVGYCDLNDGGGSVSTTNGTFAVNFHASGMFTLA